MVITKVLAHFCPPPPYKFLSPLVIFFSLPARLSFYLFLSHLVSGNRIEVRQWIVARHLSCYNPLTCFTPFCGVKHDKIKFHEFVCVCNFFSFSPLSLSPTPVSLPISLSLSRSCLHLSLPSLSLFLSFFLRLLSLFPSFSLPSLSSPSPTPTYVSLYLSLTPVSPSPSMWLSLSLPPPVSLPIFLSPTPNR